MRRRSLLMAAALVAAACTDHTPVSPAGTAALDRGNAPAASPAMAGFPSGTIPAELQLVAQGFVAPIGVVEAPDRSGRLFVIDQIGRIWIVAADGATLPTPFLDLTSRMQPLRAGYDERGVLGLAFHPHFRENGRFFVLYNAPPRTPGFDNLERLAEFHVAPGADVADPGSERPLLELDHPQFNHNGGTIAFGPGDGYLYVSLGDGGNKNDIGFGHLPEGNAQNVSQTLLGKILRLDVDHGSPYAIPAGNPFAHGGGLGEIWAWGFRNPYRFSIDMAGGHSVIVGDAGQSRWEEVNVVRRGRNYGWHIKEGFECFNPANELAPLATCPSTDAMGNPLADPAIVIENAAIGGPTIAVVGGNVYRGHASKALRGLYIFAGLSTSFRSPNGSLYAARLGGHDDRGDGTFTELVFPSRPGGRLGEFVKGFGQDRRGEVYVTTSSVIGPAGTTGRVYRLLGPDARQDRGDDAGDDHGEGGR